MMLKITIEIKPMPMGITAADHYNNTKYPGPGVYSDGVSVFVVSGSSVSYIGYTPLVSVSSVASEPKEAPPVPGISENTLLKAIAVAQNPLLIKEVLNHGM
jgi:hypothetical protein